MYLLTYYRLLHCTSYISQRDDCACDLYQKSLMNVLHIKGLYGYANTTSNVKAQSQDSKLRTHVRLTWTTKFQFTAQMMNMSAGLQTNYSLVRLAQSQILNLRPSKVTGRTLLIVTQPAQIVHYDMALSADPQSETTKYNWKRPHHYIYGKSFRCVWKGSCGINNNKHHGKFFFRSSHNEITIAFCLQCMF